MPDNFTLYLMLVAALAIGFLLGRQEWRRRREPRPPGSYLATFDHLVSEHENLDIDAFVQSVVAQDDSVETRLALGALVRRRGEVDKAIRIHQGLLARPVLTPAQRSQTELALARDYMAAGLLGRAENLLLEVSRRKGADRHAAQRGLLEVYQREREWGRAVEVGREVARQDRSIRTKIAHFQCEIAEEALALGDLRAARQALVKANHFDSGCARVGLTSARVELAAGHLRDARRLLERAVSQDADCVPLAVPSYRQACEGMSDEAGYLAFLERCLQLGPYLVAVEELAAHMERRGETAAAAEFVLEQLLRNPTLAGFVTLLEHLHREGQSLPPEELALVHRFSKSLLDRQPVYRCRNCGFSSQSLMWQCPSCHEWGTCKPIVRNQPER